MDLSRNLWFFSWSISFFSVDNSPPSHTDNLKINFLVLGERPADDVNDSTGATDSSFNSSKVNTTFCLKAHSWVSDNFW